ncbi:hypothetical protein [Streptomyces sp. NPDC048309]|uniref:hypothetical protein n=1 Tax=Streptomyces sp. NPDC048309 TaxID=3154618 RepID=UPI0033D35446
MLCTSSWTLGCGHVSPRDVQVIAAGGDQRSPPLAGGHLVVRIGHTANDAAH